jgi:hypothetical protein
MFLADILVGLTLLALVTVSLMSSFVVGFTEARTSGVHARAATWVQAEIDYLRSLGYAHACLATGTRTLTRTSGPCTALEPPLSAGLAQATVQVETNVLGRPGLKRLTVEVFRQAGPLFYRVVTYVTEFQ